MLGKLIDEALFESIFRSAVKNAYGDASILLIQKRLFEEHGISLHAAVNSEFPKLEGILYENFGDGTNSIKNQMLNDIVSLQQHSRCADACIVENQQKIQDIMNVFKDRECQLILEEISVFPKTIGELVSMTQISQTSIYRKISNMKRMNLVRSKGFRIADHGKVPKYAACFSDVKIIISKSRMTVHML